MPRITPLPRSRYSPYVRVVDVIARRMIGGPIEPLGIHARVPGLVRVEGGLERFFLSRRRKTSHRTLELVALRTALEVNCSFCIDLGSHMAASKHGVSAEELRGLSDHVASGLFGAAEVAALDLAVAMTATPAQVDDAIFARLGEHYTDQQVIEIVAMISWENARARGNAALGVESHGFAAADACAIRAPAAKQPAQAIAG